MNTQSANSMVKILAGTGMYQLGKGGSVMGELAAYDKGFELVEKRMSELETNRFALTLNTKGIGKMEWLLGISGVEGLEEAHRRSIIKTLKGSVKPVYSKNGISEVLGELGILVELAETGKDEVNLKIKELKPGAPEIGEVYHIIGLIMPAHIEVNIEYGKADFDMLDAYDGEWNQWDDKNITWNGFDEKAEEYLA